AAGFGSRWASREGFLAPASDEHGHHGAFPKLTRFAKRADFPKPRIFPDRANPLGTWYARGTQTLRALRKRAQTLARKGQLQGLYSALGLYRRSRRLRRHVQRRYPF